MGYPLNSKERLTLLDLDDLLADWTGKLPSTPNGGTPFP
jgi:hypothetical protein